MYHLKKEDRKERDMCQVTEVMNVGLSPTDRRGAMAPPTPVRCVTRIS